MLYLTLRDQKNVSLGTVSIQNITGAGDAKVADYKALLFWADEQGETRVGPVWFVYGFPRAEGAWRLAQIVIDRMPQELDREAVGPDA